ncbi:MAG: hypothetical protein JST12_07360 [Armatimonadetes bacterium]|nr:hypothetical protein [Armatimonadota bacterium]MBS1701461.1 hypothetical protein [Armatimonadota bacterium]MBS1725487.1 hypothetical protein [Armatimonadota bacterium]
MKYFVLLAMVGAVVGCNSDHLDVTNNPTTPPPTKEQLDKMPPEAAAHASQMSEYSKAMADQNKGRSNQPSNR